MNKKIILASPRGFCAGVCRALAAAEEVLKSRELPVYVLHEIVHNDYVVNSLRRRGMKFVDDLAEVPSGATVIFSAHGVPAQIEEQALQRGLQVVDATCPLVKKIHNLAGRYLAEGYSIILIGHRTHPEIIGTLGQIAGQAVIVESVSEVASLPSMNKVVYLIQTTLSDEETEPVIKALTDRFPGIVNGGGICYATRNRQQAVRELCNHCSHVLIIGSAKSSNSNRLYELALRCGVTAQLINGPDDIDMELLPSDGAVGISAGASAPEILVEQTVKRLQDSGYQEFEKLRGVVENIHFSPPKTC